MGCFVGRTRWCPEVNAFVGEINLGEFIWEVRIRRDDYSGGDGLTILAQPRRDADAPVELSNKAGYEFGITYSPPGGLPDLWDGGKKE
jgi:hypothetical protein